MVFSTNSLLYVNSSAIKILHQLRKKNLFSRLLAASCFFLFMQFRWRWFLIKKVFCSVRGKTFARGILIANSPQVIQRTCHKITGKPKDAWKLKIILIIYVKTLLRLRLNVAMRESWRKYWGGLLRWKLMIIWLLIIWFSCKFIVEFNRQNEDRIIHKKLGFYFRFLRVFHLVIVPSCWLILINEISELFLEKGLKAFNFLSLCSSARSRRGELNFSLMTFNVIRIRSN